MNQIQIQPFEQPIYKVKLFTHTDLDGVSCAILAKLAYTNTHAITDAITESNTITIPSPHSLSITYVNYNDVNQIISNFFESSEYLNYTHIYITDISVNSDVAILINSSLLNYPQISLKLLDHHKTALHLDVYDWATITVEDSIGKPLSGTTLLYNELFYDFPNSPIQQYAELVRQYDTWEWTTKYNNPIPKQFNELLYILSRERYIDNIITKLNDNDWTTPLSPSDDELFILKLRQEEIDIYIKHKNQSLIKKQIHNHNVGIVFSERFTSELGDTLCKLNPDLDIVAMINPNHSVSYRTIKPDIDVSSFAKIYGGGGHKAASGHGINDGLRNQMVDLVFNGFSYLI